MHVAAEAGRVAEIEFTPTQAGTYVFYCTVPGHREAGMEGKLIVG
ncbi:MAG: plastocyanin/azurin family copper-binding protein [Chloroflexi bacterium]|nr:plastocyanin/azurin family copper-binding protein [Chloroflexota bacterium]